MQTEPHSSSEVSSSLGAYAASVRALTQSGGDAQLEGILGEFFGIDAHDAWRFREAEALYQSALAHHRRHEQWFRVGIVNCLLGLLRVDEGDLEAARVLLDEAEAVLARVGDDRYRAVVEALRGYSCLRANDGEGAFEHLRRGLSVAQALESDQRAIFEAFVHAFFALLELERAEAAWRDGEEEHALAQLHQAERRLRSDVLPQLTASPYVRLASGRVAARWETTSVCRARPFPEAERRSTRPPLSDQREGLVVGSQGRWFRLPGGEVVDLSRRSRERRLLALLASRTAERPGQPLSVGELFEQVWPNEQVYPDVAAQRVYTAVLRLRKLGLRDMLLRYDEGYLLDPTVPVAVTE